MLYLAALLVAALTAVYFWSTRKYDYWRKRNVKYPEPVALLGNYGDYLLQRRNLGEVTQAICRQFPDEPLVGAFFGPQPVAIVQDPALLKLITTKDFYYFNGREVSEHTHKEILTKNLFFTSGDNWKVLRQNLTPLFSSAKMKNMFPLIEKCSRDLEKLVGEQSKNKDGVDVRLLISRYTMDCIGACAFGINTGVLQENSEINPFRQIGDKIFDISITRGFLTVFRAVWPGLFYALRLSMFPPQIFNFFNSVLISVFKERSLEASSRQDFVDMILTLKKSNYITGDSVSNMKGGSDQLKIKVDDEFLVAQCVLFFAAGFETSSTTSTFTLFELAKQPELQQRVLDEVDAYWSTRSEVGYDCTSELPFLEQCIEETLRLYPVLPVITREVVEDYTLPSGLKLEKGLRIHIPMMHIQRNPKYFANPDEYSPDRFSPEEKKKIVPFTYFPFGEGPRICIGMRFAKMQMMAGLVTLFKRYRVELAPGMPREVSYISTAMVTQSTVPVKLLLVPRRSGDGVQK